MDMQYIQNGTLAVADPAVAETIEVGFKPSYVKVVNVNNLAFYEHWDGMDDGTSMDTVNHDTAQISLNAADGITLTDNGFTIGTDICDTAADVVHWVCFR